MPPTGLETTIPASKQPQTHALDRAATGIGEELIGTTNVACRHNLVNRCM
jgi:hypothetical protein